MSRLFAVKHGKYVVIDFTSVTEAGLKPITSALDRAGQKVIEVEANNRQMRKDGLSIKKAKIYFERGQSITLFIGDQGDIYQMTLNGTKRPVPQVTSERDLARELANIVDQNQAKYDKSLLKKVKKAEKETSSSKPVSRSLSKRVAEATERSNTLSQTKGDLTAQLETKRAELKTESDRNADLTNKLEAEKANTAELENQLASLKEQSGND